MRGYQIEDIIDGDAYTVVVVPSGRRSSNFLVQINHGGFFVGEGRNRSYVDGRAIWYDQVERVTWSPIMIENLVEELGYEMAGRVKVFYCVPILTLGRNGLRAITDDEQAGRMLMFLDIGHHFFNIYLDHDDSFSANLSEDDVVNHPRATLPAIFNPTRRAHSNAEKAENDEAEAEHGEAEAEAEHGKGEEEAEAEAKHGNGEEAAPIPIQVVYPDCDEEEDVNQYEFVKRASVEIEDGSQRHEEQAELEGDAGGNLRMRRIARQNQVNYAMEEEDGASDTDDEDYEPDMLVDSDNEIGHDDDDLYADNVDEDEPEQRDEKKSNEKAKQKLKDKNILRGILFPPTKTT